jgi:hypothetical protein
MHNFLEIWNQAMYILAPASAVVGILIYIYLKIKIASASDLKDKHEVYSEFSVKYLQAAHISFAIGIFFIVNVYNTATVEKNVLWFFIRMFMGIALGTMYGYIAYLMLKYYYPTRLTKKLHKLRYTPRINPATGNKMRLLSEQEEDEYLDEKMQAEESVFSVDYDVWIDEQTGTTKIEKYQGRLTAEQCDRCNLHTLKLEREELITVASETQDGETLKHYKCSYCARIKRKTMVIPRHKSEGEYVVSDTAAAAIEPVSRRQVTVVKIEIFDNTGVKEGFEFQNLEEAQRFLGQFELSETTN